MKKSELKKRLIEALTPDEAAKVEPKYKETYAAMIKGKGPLKLKKYDNPDKVVRGRVVNTIKNESLKIAEKLGKTADVGDYKDDFRKSDAPQFKGKSKKKRDQMATAAFLNKEEQKLDEIDAMMEDAKDKSEKNYSNYFKKMDKNRLEELVKAALMGPISEKKFPDLNDDGKITKADVLIGRGVKLEETEDIPDAAILKINAQVKDKPSMAQAMIDFYDQVKKKEAINFETGDTFDRALGLFKTIAAKGKTNEDVVKGSNIKKVGDKYRVLSGKTGKMWKQKYDSKKDAEAALRGYFASQNESLAETILKELRGSINEMAGEDLELKSLAKKMIPTLKKLGFEVEYSTDTSMKTLKNAGDKFVALRVQDGMLGAHIPFKAGLDAAKEIQKEIQKSLGNEFEYKLTKSKRGSGLEFYTILIRNK